MELFSYIKDAYFMVVYYFPCFPQNIKILENPILRVCNTIEKEIIQFLRNSTVWSYLANSIQTEPDPMYPILALPGLAIINTWTTPLPGRYSLSSTVKVPGQFRMVLGLRK